MIQGQEFRLEVDGLTYAGLLWGDPESPLVLALHGWLDNALSFAELAPRLHGYRVLSLDLSGHGYSSHRSPDATYNIWDDLPQLEAIVSELTSEPVTLIGHSRGATIATLLAAVLGERCSRLVMIDGLMPGFMDQRNAGSQLKSFVFERNKYRARPPRFFASVEEFAQRRLQYGFTTESAHALAPRALEHGPQGYRLLSDTRLYGASATWLDPIKRAQIYASVTAPVLGIFAERGLFANSETAQKMLEDAGAALPDFRSLVMAGSHHLHMEAEVLDRMVQRVEQFLRTGQ